jgi:hypothetical protein
VDKEFWEALGRGLGWNESEQQPVAWLWKWHRFIDHLAAGRTADEFFAGLLEQ